MAEMNFEASIVTHTGQMFGEAPGVVTVVRTKRKDGFQGWR